MKNIYKYQLIECTKHEFEKLKKDNKEFQFGIIEVDNIIYYIPESVEKVDIITLILSKEHEISEISKYNIKRKYKIISEDIQKFLLDKKD